jgi:hypothetical protein
MRAPNAVLVGLVALFAVGCGGDRPGTKLAQQKAQLAAPGVVPGSYEDWCSEHSVPESQCTRCNPELIAAFKATADWCEEHSLPESQCLACNPDLVIERPAKPEVH